VEELLRARKKVAGEMEELSQKLRNERDGQKELQ
jgi:hypothetical protein